MSLVDPKPQDRKPLKRETLLVRNTRPSDIPAIAALCRAVYPESAPWREDQLANHQRVFPEGQWVAVVGERVVGMAASLIVRWDDYGRDHSWREVTAHGTFENHDPARGRTLYAAEVMVDPTVQGRGIGARLYAARRKLVERLGLRRIRAGARLRGYHRYAAEMTALEYAVLVARGEVYDPTVTFQLRQGFRLLWIVEDYLRHDPESQGWAAAIEWLNRAVAEPEDFGQGDPALQVPFDGPAARGGAGGRASSPRLRR